MLCAPPAAHVKHLHGGKCLAQNHMTGWATGEPWNARACTHNHRPRMRARGERMHCKHNHDTLAVLSKRGDRSHA
eukprot:9343221-Alexandrium_andersonii.AAC.1